MFHLVQFYFMTDFRICYWSRVYYVSDTSGIRLDGLFLQRPLLAVNGQC